MQIIHLKKIETTSIYFYSVIYTAVLKMGVRDLIKKKKEYIYI